MYRKLIGIVIISMLVVPLANAAETVFQIRELLGRDWHDELIDKTFTAVPGACQNPGGATSAAASEFDGRLRSHALHLSGRQLL